MRTALDLTGRTFGYLSVTKRSENRRDGHVRWQCVCSLCGNIHEANGSDLNRERLKSCGCHKGKHGFTRRASPKGPSPFHVWRGMKKRCLDPKHDRFYRYGARGITICSEWLESEVFIQWALNNGWKPGLQLDRIDNDGNYEPSNCRFVTPSVNCLNRGPRRSNAA